MTTVQAGVRLPVLGDGPHARAHRGRHPHGLTDALLDGWERVIARSGRRSVSSAAAVSAAVRKFFPDSEVPFGAYTDLVADMPGKDPDDRVHMAAAVAGHATHIVTHNLSDFPAARLAEYGVTVTDPDTYLCDLFGEFRDEVTSTAGTRQSRCDCA